MYKIALIGYGRWGKILISYLDCFFNVNAVFGRSIKKEGRFTNDLDDIFSSGVNAVVIATPIGTHYEIAWQALKHDKHVFCEKPLTIHPSSARELSIIANEKGLHLVTDYIYTFSKRLKEIKDDLIDNNKIGKLRKMTLTLKRNSENSGVDIYWNLASHMLAVLDTFFSLESLSFERKTLALEKEGIVSFKGKINGQILVNSKSPNKETEIVFRGDGGRFIYNKLHEGNGLTYSMEYFKGVLDGSINNRTNIARAISVTDILWRLEQE